VSHTIAEPEGYEARESQRPRRARVVVAVTVALVAIAAVVVAALLLAGPRPGSPVPGTNTLPALDTTSTARPGIAATAPAGSELDTRAAPTLEPTPLTPPTFDAVKAMADVRTIEAFGVRAAGSEAERQAVDYIAGRLSRLGYSPVVEDVPLPNGRISHNVSAGSIGTSPYTIVLGAHLDSKPPSPGANDNATGCAALLEIARILVKQPVTPQVEFIFFGAEETIDENPDHHHFGSRARVANLTEAERARIAGVISVDMIGYGPDFAVRTMQRRPRSMADLLLATSKATGAGLRFLADPGKTGWSDHEPYELAGIPAAWIEWRDDPVFHTAEDTSGHIEPEKVRVAGQLVLDVLRGLDVDALERLAAR